MADHLCARLRALRGHPGGHPARVSREKAVAEANHHYLSVPVPGDCCTQHRHPAIGISASQDGASREDPEGPEPSGSSKIVLFVKFTHPQRVT